MKLKLLLYAAPLLTAVCAAQTASDHTTNLLIPVFRQAIQKDPSIDSAVTKAVNDNPGAIVTFERDRLTVTDTELVIEGIVSIRDTHGAILAGVADLPIKVTVEKTELKDAEFRLEEHGLCDCDDNAVPLETIDDALEHALGRAPQAPKAKSDDHAAAAIPGDALRKMLAESPLKESSVEALLRESRTNLLATGFDGRDTPAGLEKMTDQAKLTP